MFAQKFAIALAIVALCTVMTDGRSIKVNSSMACPLCVHAIDKIRQETDVTKLEDMVPALCLFSKDKLKCVAKLVDRIEDLHDLSSKEICLATHLCHMEKTAEASIGCPTCVHAMAFAKKTLGNPEVQQDLLSIIPILCTFSGSKCTEKLSDHLMKATNVLSRSTPVNLCTEMQMCYPEDRQIEVELEGSFACPMCKYVFKKAKSLVLQNKTDTEIIGNIQKVCVIFRTHKQVCLNLIEQKVKPVLSKLRYSDETKICQQLKMCDAPTMQLQDTTDLCTFATEEGQALQSVLRDPSNIQPIFDAIKDNCSSFGIFATSCTNFFDGIVKNVVGTILKLNIPVFLKHLHICA